jgi:exodeoxyribonuclease III
VEEWLAEVEPDVLCLQETKLSDAAFPALSFQALGYEAAHHGQGQWNGVAILSRVGLGEVVHGFAPDASESQAGAGLRDTPEVLDEYQAGVLNEARIVTARCAGVTICSVYVPNGRSLDDPHLQAKLKWLARLRRHLGSVSSPSEALLVLGDFNIAPDDRDVWDPKRFVGSTHVTPEERQQLGFLHDWGLVDLFRELYPQDRLYTYWDYRAGDFHMHRGMRIDLALGTQPVRDALRWAIVDRNARKGKLPSDHAPLVVDIEVPAQSHGAVA